MGDGSSDGWTHTHTYTQTVERFHPLTEDFRVKKRL